MLRHVLIRFMSTEKKPQNIFLLLVCFVLLLLLVSCTDYERAGVNPRPFNEPAEWEYYPYGNAFRN